MLSFIIPRFNPRAREGRDFSADFQGALGYVSIHAPARGATLDRALMPGHAAVSIHAPARGATWQDQHDPFFDCGFNPRAREGRDLLAGRCPVCRAVSIHAPARGATMHRVKHPRVKHGFNPRAREGRDAAWTES